MKPAVSQSDGDDTATHAAGATGLGNSLEVRERGASTLQHLAELGHRGEAVELDVLCTGGRRAAEQTESSNYQVSVCERVVRVT